MSLILSAVATVIIALTGFADHNGNQALDAGEQLAGGAYEVYYTAPDGAVAMVMVSLPTGHWYALEVFEGEYEIMSGCGSLTLDTNVTEFYVPVICRSVFLPLAFGGR